MLASKVNDLDSRVRPSRLALHASQMWTERLSKDKVQIERC